MDDHITEIHIDYLFLRIREGTKEQCAKACDEIRRRLEATQHSVQLTTFNTVAQADTTPPTSG